MNGALKKSVFTAFIIYLTLTYLTFLLSGEQIKKLTNEDGIFENLGAIYFLVCSLLFGFAIFYSRQKKTGKFLKKNIFYLLLGIVFFVAFMEEISWGQRVLDLKTPENLAELNVQKEINIHNLKWFHGNDESGQEKDFWHKLTNLDRLFTLFSLTFCFVIPFAYRYNSRIRVFLEKVKLPIVSMFLGFLFVINYLVSKFLEWSLSDLGHAVTEIKEANVAFLFMWVALFEISKMKLANNYQTGES